MSAIGVSPENVCMKRVGQGICADITTISRTVATFLSPAESVKIFMLLLFYGSFTYDFE